MPQPGASPVLFHWLGTQQSWEQIKKILMICFISSRDEREDKFQCKWTAELWKQLLCLVIKEGGPGQRGGRCWVTLALQLPLYHLVLIQSSLPTCTATPSAPGMSQNPRTGVLPKYSESWALLSLAQLLHVQKMTSTRSGGRRLIRATVLVRFPVMETNALLN